MGIVDSGYKSLNPWCSWLVVRGGGWLRVRVRWGHLTKAWAGFVCLIADCYQLCSLPTDQTAESQKPCTATATSNQQQQATNHSPSCFCINGYLVFFFPAYKYHNTVGYCGKQGDAHYITMVYYHHLNNVMQYNSTALQETSFVGEFFAEEVVLMFHTSQPTCLFSAQLQPLLRSSPLYSSGNQNPVFLDAVYIYIKVCLGHEMKTFHQWVRGYNLYVHKIFSLWKQIPLLWQ